VTVGQTGVQGPASAPKDRAAALERENKIFEEQSEGQSETNDSADEPQGFEGGEESATSQLSEGFGDQDQEGSPSDEAVSSESEGESGGTFGDSQGEQSGASEGSQSFGSEDEGGEGSDEPQTDDQEAGPDAG
jgi:hypothetical protein